MILPTIVVAEAIYIARKKDYELEMKEIVEDLKVSSNYFVKPISHSILSKLAKDERDLSIHDKIIVLTAEEEGVGIISKDDRMKEKSEVDVIWER